MADNYERQRAFLAKRGIRGTAETMSLIAGGKKDLLYRLLEEYHQEVVKRESEDRFVRINAFHAADVGYMEGDQHAKPMTVSILRDKMIQLCEMQPELSDDLVFTRNPEFDEADTDGFIPISNITGNHVHFLNGQEELLKDLMSRESTDMFWIAPTTRSIKSM